MLKPMIHGCLIALAVALIAGAILWTTDPMPCLAMLAGAAVLYLPVIDNAKAFFESRADDRVKGDTSASQGWFARTLREREIEQETRLITLAECKGRAEALLDEREAKLSRMIGHKDARGRFSKAPSAPLIDGVVEHDNHLG